MMVYSNLDNVIRQLWRRAERGSFPQIYAILDAVHMQSVAAYIGTTVGNAQTNGISGDETIKPRSDAYS